MQAASVPKPATSIVLPIVVGVGTLGVLGVAGYFGYQAYNKIKSQQLVGGQQSSQGCTTCGGQQSAATQQQKIASQQQSTGQISQPSGQSATQKQTVSQQQIPATQAGQQPIQSSQIPTLIQSPFPEGKFKIVNDVKENLVVDAKGGSKNAMGSFILWPFHGGDNQTFVFDDANDTISNAGSSLNLSSGWGGGVPTNGDLIVQLPSTANANRQKWDYDAASKELKLSGTDLCLDASGSVKQGTKMIAYKCHGGDNQRWDLVKI
jgi:Ricin-type beta-trefoil lectin domain